MVEINDRSYPGFSIVTPSYNQARFLRTNIEAVIAQDYPNVEHLICDNASTDGTLAVLREFPATNWVSERDSGQSEAINKAVARSRNEWIVWVNSDDFLLPGALHAIAAAIRADDGIDFIYSNIVHVDEQGAVTEKRRPNYSPWKLRHWWWGSLQLWQPGTVFRRRIFDAAGPLDPTLHYAMDFDYFLRAQDHCRFTYVDRDLVAFRHHAAQKSHQDEIRFIEERAAATRKYWRERNRAAAAIYRVVLFFALGSSMFIEGLRALERGDRGAAWTLVRRGLRRNPLALLRPEHAGFWLRKCLGRERYYRLRRGGAK